MTPQEPAPSIPLYSVPMPPHAADAVANVLNSGQVAGGPNVARFEEAFGRYLGNPLVTSAGDISSALTLCLFLAGVRPGDEVLMSPLVCLSTSCPARNLFAQVRWCDAHPRTGNLDPARLAERISPRTKAIVVYHWAGNPADLDAVHAVARTHGLPVIEDAGEALGAEYHGRKIGNTGSDYTVFSFYPNRHLTTIEGAAIAFARREDFERARWLKRYGIHQPSFRDEDEEISPESDIPVAGWNTYMNHVAATIGLAQMDQLGERIARHQENGLHYSEALKGVSGIELLEPAPDSRSAYWVYTFLARDRDRLLRRLRARGVHASKVHLRNDRYSCFGAADVPLPGVDYFADRCLSIPCGWWIGNADRARIADAVRREAS